MGGARGSEGGEGDEDDGEVLGGMKVRSCGDEDGAGGDEGEGPCRR